MYSGLTHAKLHGVVSFNTSKVSVTGMPKGTHAPGSTITAHIKVKNTGVEPETYQLDPRTTTQTPYDGVSLENPSGTLPVTFDDTIPEYVVPPFSSQLKLDASTTGSTPISFDTNPFWGSPDIASPVSTAPGTTSVTVSNPIASPWAIGINEVGPPSNLAEPPEDYSTDATVTTLGFDETAVANTGDVWDNFANNGKETLRPLFLQPGQSGTMSVKFTVPSGAPGTTVTGVIPVETFNYNSLPQESGVGDWSSDVLRVLHYSYTLGS